MSPPPEIEVTLRDGVVVVRLNLAVVGFTEADRLREPLRLASGEPPRLLLDLAAVDDFRSAGMGIILGMHRRLIGRGGRLVLCHLKPRVRECFAPFPSKQSIRPDWNGPFFARTLDEALALMDGQRSPGPEAGDD